MNKILNKYSALNNLKIVNGVSIVLTIYVNLLVLSAFARFHSLRSLLPNPLLPQEYVSDVFAPYAKVGMILSIGLIPILLLKFMRQNLIVIVGAMFLIAFYYLTDLTSVLNS